jgi:lipopolysaccharide/colanic/teichoic acid biosynthesis glycosyltransferase
VASDIPIVSAGTNRHGDLYRRAFDVVASLLLGSLALPIVLVAAIGSAVTLRAWPIFAQDRVGLDGELFRLLKIRTLPTTVPAYLDKHQLGSFSIPKFCRLLRALHIDELPQLYVVLIGRMSLVGPRPEMAHLHDLMPTPFATERTTVRPGCTGLWQVSESCTDLISAAPEYDRFYLAHRSVRLDVWVLFRTMLKMTGVSRCVTLAQVPAWTANGSDIAEVDIIDLRDEPSAESSIAIRAAASR